MKKCLNITKNMFWDQNWSFLGLNLMYGSRMDRGWIEDGSRMDGFVGRWAGWLNIGPPQPTPPAMRDPHPLRRPHIGKKSNRVGPRKEDYLWFRKGCMASHVSMGRRVDVCGSAFDSDTPTSRRITHNQPTSKRVEDTRK